MAGQCEANHFRSLFNVKQILALSPSLNVNKWLELSIVNSRQPKYNFLTPQPLPHEFQEELGQLFFSSYIANHTKTDSSDKGYSRLDPSQSRLVKIQINEIRKQLVTSDHRGAVICGTQFHSTQGERAPKKWLENLMTIFYTVRWICNIHF